MSSPFLRRENPSITLYAYANMLLNLGKGGCCAMKELERYFKALADANRLRIANLLLHGELCVCDIQYVLENSQPNISRPLAYLKRCEMVLDRRDGYRVFYRLANAKTADKRRLFDFLRVLFEAEKQ